MVGVLELLSPEIHEELAWGGYSEEGMPIRKEYHHVGKGRNTII